MTLQRLPLTIGLILLVFQLISTFCYGMKAPSKLTTEQAPRIIATNDAGEWRNVKLGEAVASLIVPGGIYG